MVDDEERSEEPRKQLRDEDVVDSLPDDLDAAGYVGPYLFPNNNRRRIPGITYLLLAALCLALYLGMGDGAVLVNEGFAWAALGLAAAGAYSLLSGWNLDVDEHDALVAAVARVGFPVGHASAQMGWRGLRSRPTWRVLVYSAEDPPSTRGLVLVDGVDGSIVEWFTEENPEDWSELVDPADVDDVDDVDDVADDGGDRDEPSAADGDPDGEPAVDADPGDGARGGPDA